MNEGKDQEENPSSKDVHGGGVAARTDPISICSRAFDVVDVVVNNIISNVPRRVSDESEYFVLDNLDFFMWVAAAAPQTGEAYVIIGRRTCLYRTTLFSRESGEFLPTREIAK
ncbi:hypothetical protein TNCV_3598501 [Trichonephila clavipes]|nr:hypothetical protein TNCV_3598501 [Trichonephila clavipes]